MPRVANLIARGQTLPANQAGYTVLLAPSILFTNGPVPAGAPWLLYDSNGRLVQSGTVGGVGPFTGRITIAPVAPGTYTLVSNPTNGLQFTRKLNLIGGQELSEFRTMQYGGNPPATIKTISITDSVTNQPVSAVVTLTAVLDPNIVAGPGGVATIGGAVGIPSGEYTLVAKASGYQTVTETVPVSGTGWQTGISMVRVTATVTVQVVDAGGAPAAGASVVLSPAGPSGTTDASGQVTFAGVEGGSYTANATGTDGSKGAAPVAVTTTVAVMVTVQLQPVSLPASVTVIAEPSGAPVAGVTVVLAAASSSTLVTNAQGVANFGDVPLGTYQVTVKGLAAGYAADATASLVIATTTTGTVTVQLEQLAQLQLQVVDGSGNPVTGAAVSLDTASGTTDSTGAVAFQAAAGTYQLTVDGSSAGLGTVQQSVTLEAGKVDALQVTLSALTGGLALTVVDTSGAPVQGATVAVGTPAVAQGQTNGAGQATFTGLAPGDYQVTVSASGMTTITDTLTVTAGSVQSATATLHAATGAIALTVVDGQGNAIPGASVAVSGPSSGQATSDQTGVATVSGLAPGTYQVTVGAQGFVSQTDNLTVTAGTTTPAKATLAPTPVVTQTTGGNGALLVGVMAGGLLLLLAAGGRRRKEHRP